MSGPLSYPVFAGQSAAGRRPAGSESAIFGKTVAELDDHHGLASFERQLSGNA